MKSNLTYTILGTLLQSIFPLLVYPYITRVLGVSNLGEYDFYISTVNYLALFSAFGIPLMGTKEIGKYKDNKDYYSPIFIRLLLLNIIICILIYLFIVYLILFSESYHNAKLFIITSITLLGNAVGAEYFFVALEKQKYLFIRNVCFKILSLILIFLFVCDNNDLIIYALIMLFSTVGVSLANILYYSPIVNWSGFRLSDLNFANLIFPLAQLFFMEILIHYYGRMDIVILGLLDTTTAVGLYSISSKIYYIAYSFLASTAIPLLPRAAYYIEKGFTIEYNSLIKRGYDIYIFFLTYISFVLYFYAKDLVVLLAGREFLDGYASLKCFSVTLFFSSFCNLFIFQVLYPKNKGKMVLISLLLSVSFNILFSILLIPCYSYMGAAVAFLLSHIFLFVWFIFRGWRDLPKFSGCKDFVKEMIGLLICYVVCSCLKDYHLHLFIYLIISFVIFCVIGFVLKNQVVYYFLNTAMNYLHKD